MRDVDQSYRKKDRTRDINLVVLRVDRTTNTNYYQYDDTISLTGSYFQVTHLITQNQCMFLLLIVEVYICVYQMLFKY